MLQSNDIADVKLAIEIVNNSYLDQQRLMNCLSKKEGWHIVNTKAYREHNRIDHLRKLIGESTWIEFHLASSNNLYIWNDNLE